MATRPPSIEQTTPHDPRFDSLRTELENKIDNKLSKEFFFWAIPIIIAITGSILWYLQTQINKYDDLNRRITVIETENKIKDQKKP